MDDPSDQNDPQSPPPLEPRQRNVFLLILAVEALAIVAAIAADEGDRIALPLGFLLLATIAGFMAYRTANTGFVYINAGTWEHPNYRWVHRSKVPARYRNALALWVVISIGSGFFSIAGLLGWMQIERPTDAPPPSLSGLENAMWIVLLAAAGIGAAVCLTKAMHNRKPDSDWRFGRLLRPRHLTDAGKRWWWQWFAWTTLFVIIGLAASFRATP